MRERERERQTETETERERQTDRDYRQTDRQTETEWDTEREADRPTDWKDSLQIYWLIYLFVRGPVSFWNTNNYVLIQTHNFTTHARLYSYGNTFHSLILHCCCSFQHYYEHKAIHSVKFTFVEFVFEFGGCFNYSQSCYVVHTLCKWLSQHAVVSTCTFAYCHFNYRSWKSMEGLCHKIKERFTEGLHQWITVADKSCVICCSRSMHIYSTLMDLSLKTILFLLTRKIK